MVHAPFADQNRLSDAKTTFSVTNGLKIRGKPLKIMQNMHYWWASGAGLHLRVPGVTIGKGNVF